jgi:hypothetical protein
MLGLPGLGPHDSLSRLAALPECQTPSSRGGGMGSKEPGSCPGVASQSQVRTAVCQVPGAVGGRVMADGTDEDGAHAARTDEWVAWETVEEEAPRGEG